MPKEPKFSDFYQSPLQKQSILRPFVEVVSALNDEVTRLIGKRPTEAIKEETIAAKPSTPYHRPVGANEKKLPTLVNVRYLYKPGDAERQRGGGERATDPAWSLKVYNIEGSISTPKEPVLYYLQNGPKRGFVPPYSE